MPLIFFLASAGVFFFSLLSAAGGAELSIQFHTTPALEQLRPHEDAAAFALRVTDAGGRPLESGDVVVALDAPKPGAFLTTDFPLIEGKRLFEFRLPLNQGQVAWRYLLPIRGNYRLSVTVTASDGRTGIKHFDFAVSENRAKWLWLGLFSCGLFLAGFIAGRIFTGAAALTLLLTVTLLSAFGEFAVGHEAAKTVAGENANGSIDIEPATVGKLARVRWRATTASSGEKSLSLSIVHLEKGKMVFGFDQVAVEKEFAFNFQFTDGTEYRIETSAEAPGQGAERSQQTVSVTGVEPPLTTQIPAVMLFVAVITLGLGAGRMSKRRPV